MAKRFKFSVGIDDAAVVALYPYFIYYTYFIFAVFMMIQIKDQIGHCGYGDKGGVKNRKCEIVHQYN